MTLPRPASNRTAVVTGASSGIGAAIARDLADRGHGVTLVARRADKLTELAAELSGRGVRAEVLATDLSDRGARAALLGRITELGLTPDILVNNAGLGTFGPVAASDPDTEAQMIEVDVVAVADLCARFLPGMTERRRGAVLNVASTAAFQPMPGQAGYGACKAFVLSYTQALAGELKGTSVTATALCPGPVDTGFGATAGFSKEEADELLPAFLWVSPEEVASAAVDAMAQGRMVVVPGLANKAGSIFAQLAPRKFLVPLLARQHPALHGVVK